MKEGNGIVKKYRKILSVLLILCFFSLNLAGCSEEQEPDKKAGKNGKDAKPQVQAAAAAPFAAYKPVEYEVKPAIKPYTIENGLANVANIDRFNLNEENKSTLQRQGFMVYEERAEEFYNAYEFNRYEGVPNFVTTDAMLHSYHLLFDFILADLEAYQLSSATQSLSEGMLQAAEKQYEALKGTDWENAAKINMGFFAVGNALINPKAVAPAPVADEVGAELALIEAHEGIILSPVFNIGKTELKAEDYKEDYSQYIPRSHYTKSEALKSYFKTMMWYGRMTFLLKEDDTAKAAILMSLALQEGENAKTWQKIYDTTAFFAGVSDDVNVLQVADLVEQTYGKKPDLKKITTDKDKYKNLVKDIGYLAKPKINSIPIIEKETAQERQEQIDGVRFMGQRYTIDADIFQNLVFPAVGKNKAGDRRMLPDRLDIAAAFGSELAMQQLKQGGAFEFSNYQANMGKMSEYIESLSRDTWRQDLYWSWMDMLKPLLEAKPDGYPLFMLNDAWIAKDLNAYLGSWTELKHDTLLYSKQVYAEMGGYPEPKYDDRGYVEPQPEIYARLAALSAFMRDGLKSRDMLSAHNEDLLNIMEQLSRQLLAIAVKELENQPLTDEEYELIRTIGGQLEHIWYETQLDKGNKDKRQLLLDNPAPLIADVATDPDGGEVLEVGTGYVTHIYVIVPIDGNLVLTRGGVFSTHQFAWPMSDRLTDKKWREMLRSGTAADFLQPEDWQKSFMGQLEERGLINYNKEDEADSL